ncbi:MAG: DEAD/DEAH box helicase, partial [Chloroflexota bacterium]
MDIDNYLSSRQWATAGNLTIPAREKKVFAINDLALTQQSKNVLNASPYNGRVYLHQKKTIQFFLEGNNVCLATGTASGKSLAFQIAAVEALARNPTAKVIAIYPMKALGNEQASRWRDLMIKAEMKLKVGRIDGSVKGKKNRLDILKNSQIVVFTPDIIHAWLFSNLSNETVQEFLRNISLIIVDEIHTYTGVFGSNTAFLFRRIRHTLDLFGTSAQFICASATISEPLQHLQKLFGIDFTLVDQEEDTSPKHETNIQLIQPPKESNFLTEITQLLSYITQHTTSRFITFVDSRVQVEHITSILSREKGDDDEIEDTSLLEKLQVLPYRAGYEDADRNKIQDRLRNSKLRGVVSTSALELGLDIPGLDLCVLVGVPSSQTSLYQRIGRIGRHSKGHVLIIYGGDIYDQAVFANPQELLRRPPAESALYLENQYIQYIHALCLARLDGEHDQIQKALHK